MLNILAAPFVAPLVGAWIEIKQQAQVALEPLSLLSWERGLKYRSAKKSQNGTGVAPLVGAWIEIKKRPEPSVEAMVAPLVGAWIEMPMTIMPCFLANVAPLVGAWIEIPKNLRR